MSVRAILFMAIGLMLAALGRPAMAAETESEPAAQQQAEARETAISQRRASELVRERYQGRVLNIRLDEGRWIVRMDDDGTVFNVFVNARSGEVTGPDR